MGSARGDSHSRVFLFKSFFLTLTFLKVTIGSVPDVGCHYYLNKKRSTGRWFSLSVPSGSGSGSVQEKLSTEVILPSLPLNLS